METKRIVRMCNTQKCGFENICDRKVDNPFDILIRAEQTKRQVYGVYNHKTQSCVDFVKRPQKPPKLEIVVNPKWIVVILTIIVISNFANTLTKLF